MAQYICTSLKERLPELPEPGSPLSVHHQQLDLILAEIEHNRGCIATEINEPYDALRYHTIFNALMVQELGNTFGGRDMRLAISWNELGCAHMLNKNWQKGHDCFQRSIELMQQLDGFEETWISLPLVNLGLAHWLQGRHEEALNVLLNGQKHRESMYGVDDRVSFM